MKQIITDHKGCFDMEDIVKRISSILTAIILLFAVGASANAQDQSKRAAAEELLNLVNMKETSEKSSAMIKQMVLAQIQQMRPQKGDAAVSAQMTSQIQKLMDMISYETSWYRIKEEYITLYSEVFTEPELKDMIAFYKTPSGHALIAKQPEVMRRSMELSQKRTGELMPKIQAMTNELKESILKELPPPPKPEASEASAAMSTMASADFAACLDESVFPVQKMAIFVGDPCGWLCFTACSFWGTL